MIEILIRTVLILFFSSLPLFLWGYGSVYLSNHVWNRLRFFAGMIGWGVSVLSILFFEKWLKSTQGYESLFAIIGIFLLLAGIVWIVTIVGSPYIRWFLRRTLFFHIALFCILLLSWSYLRDSFVMTSWALSFLAGISGFFFAAFLEEGVKHVSSIGLTAWDFRFTRVDFLLFAFFVTLWFVAVENIVYLLQASNISAMISTGIYRMILALPLHILAASICVMFWWKAMAYELFSWRYTGLFVTGYLSAIAIHSLYNFLAMKGQLGLLIVIAIVSYIAFTQWILLSEEGKWEKSLS